MEVCAAIRDWTTAQIPYGEADFYRMVCGVALRESIEPTDGSGIPSSGVTQENKPQRSRGCRHASLTSVLWQWVCRSVTLFGELQPNRKETMTLTHSGTLIPEIVRRGFQDLQKAEISGFTGALLYECCPHKSTTSRNSDRQRLLTTQLGDIRLDIS